MKLVSGLIFTAPGVTGDIDHPCILLTDDFEDAEQVFVNLTDYRNNLDPAIDIPAGTKLSTGFTTSKRSTIAYNYAERVSTFELKGRLEDIRAKNLGACDSGWLEKIRLALFESDDTPPHVLTFCEPLDWGF